MKTNLLKFDQLSTEAQIKAIKVLSNTDIVKANREGFALHLIYECLKQEYNVPYKYEILISYAPNKTKTYLSHHITSPLNLSAPNNLSKQKINSTLLTEKTLPFCTLENICQSIYDKVNNYSWDEYIVHIINEFKYLFTPNGEYFIGNEILWCIKEVEPIEAFWIKYKTTPLDFICQKLPCEIVYQNEWIVLVHHDPESGDTTNLFKMFRTTPDLLFINEYYIFNEDKKVLRELQRKFCGIRIESMDITFFE